MTSRHAEVGAIQSAGPHPHQHFIGLGHWCRCLAKHCTGLSGEDCLHFFVSW
jgi:hypothetical protein